MHNADNVAELTRKVAEYGSALARVFHHYELSEIGCARGLEDAMNATDSTIASLNQVLSLFKDEAEDIRTGNGKRLFSEEGLKYVQLLSEECAVNLAKLELIIKDTAALNEKELRQKHKRDKEALAEAGQVRVDLSVLKKLDEETFLEILSETRWYLAHTFIKTYSARLREVQLGFLLICEVVTAWALSSPS